MSGAMVATFVRTRVGGQPINIEPSGQTYAERFYATIYTLDDTLISIGCGSEEEKRRIEALAERTPGLEVRR